MATKKSVKSMKSSKVADKSASGKVKAKVEPAPAPEPVEPKANPAAAAAAVKMNRYVVFYEAAPEPDDEEGQTQTICVIVETPGDLSRAVEMVEAATGAEWILADTPERLIEIAGEALDETVEADYRDKVSKVSGRSKG